MTRGCLVCLLLLAAACSDDECVEVDPNCTPLYEPTFENVFNNTLLPKCGVSGGACHGDAGRQNGLGLVEIDEAYDLLLESRVIPNDPSCSLIVRRIESDDPSFAMPPGAPLSAQERCAIEKWIANGAPR
jgi:hypothetical protein